MKKGQSTIELAILILIVVVALLSMQVYMKRGVQGRYREISNDIGDQYDPKHTDGQMTMTHTSTVVTEVDMEEEGGVATDTTKVTTEADDNTRSGTENLAPMDVGLW